MQNEKLDSDSFLSLSRNDSSKKSTASNTQPSSNLINLELLAETIALITQVQEFQERMWIWIKNKYTQNYKVVIFWENDIITLQILKENCVAMDNYQVIVMIKNILYVS